MIRARRLLLCWRILISRNPSSTLLLQKAQFKHLKLKLEHFFLALADEDVDEERLPPPVRLSERDKLHKLETLVLQTCLPHVSA